MTRLAFLPICALAGCSAIDGAQISLLSETEIRSASHEKVCSPYATGKVVATERARRELGDCSRPHVRCRELGLKVGTELYDRCRTIAGHEGVIGR